MSTADDTGQITLTTAGDESTSVIMGSLIALGLDVLVYTAIAVHTIMCRRKYGRYIEEMPLTDLSLPIQFFMMTPGPIYAAGFLLAIVGLILKECAIERKSVALKINLFALAVAIFLFVTFLYTVQFHFDAMIL